MESFNLCALGSHHIVKKKCCRLITGWQFIPFIVLLRLCQHKDYELRNYKQRNCSIELKEKFYDIPQTIREDS